MTYICGFEISPTERRAWERSAFCGIRYRAGIRSDSYFNMIAADDFPNVVGSILVEDGTIQKQENGAVEIKKQLEDMWTLQYDRMFGNQYSLMK